MPVSLALYILAVYGLAFALQQKAGPVVLQALRVPVAAWYDRSARAALSGPQRFAVGLLTCSFCLGFHAGWVVWLVACYLPEVCLYPLAGAAACYLIDTTAKRLEA